MNKSKEYSYITSVDILGLTVCVVRAFRPSVCRLGSGITLENRQCIRYGKTASDKQSRWDKGQRCWVLLQAIGFGGTVDC